MSWVKVWKYEKYVRVTQLRASGSLRHTLNRISSTLTRNKYQYLQAITLPVKKNLGFLDTMISTFSFIIIFTKIILCPK